jgi:hypothetical protein
MSAAGVPVGGCPSDVLIEIANHIAIEFCHLQGNCSDFDNDFDFDWVTIEKENEHLKRLAKQRLRQCCSGNCRRFEASAGPQHASCRG